jgi:hypothetical protein
VVHSDHSLTGIRKSSWCTDSYGREQVERPLSQRLVTAKIISKRATGRRRPFGPSIKKALESIRNFDTGGITWPFSFSETSHKGITKMKLGVVNKGAWTMITGFVSAEDLQ